MRTQGNQSHGDKQLLYILFFLLFLVALLIGLSFNITVFRYVQENHPGIFYIYKKILRSIKPLHTHWYVVALLYVFFCFVLAWQSQGKRLDIHFKQYHPYLLPALLLNIILLFLSLFLLISVPLFPFVLAYSCYAVCLVFCPGLIFLYKRSHDPTVNTHLSPISQRIKQAKSYVESPYSFRWKTDAGWVSLYNVFRGAMIVAGPGAGKSYSLIEPIIDQAIRYGFSGLIYDFKFPTLSLYAYNAYQEALKAGQTECDFYCIYFKSPKYSNQCNPLHPKVLTEYAFANESSKTILYNINLNWAQKSGEFFSDSAVTILTGVIWYLRCKAIETGRNICTIPHVVEFCSYDDFDRTIELMLDNPEVSANISALRSAQKTGAGEQLGGQLGSLQIAMSKLNDKKMAWVTSGDDFTLDINVKPDKEKNIRPRIVVLGNDDMLKKSYAPALSLFASTCAGLINQKGRIPCAFIVDECPTLVIQNIENLPNTGRSNKIFCCICMQDFSQLNLNYGDKAAKVLRAGFGNIFIGEVSDEDTARYAANLIGKGIITRQNVSESDQSTSVSYNEQFDLLIHPHEIMRLDTGEFVGKVTDVPRKKSYSLFSDKSDESKIFAAKFHVEKPSSYYKDSQKQEYRHTLPVSPHFNFGDITPEEEEKRIDEILTQNIFRIRQEINELVASEYWLIKIKKYMKNSPYPHVRQEYEDLIRRGKFHFFCRPYIEMAEQIYNTITNNAITTERKTPANNPNNFVFTKVIAQIEADLQSDAEIID